jgi:Xaa-Pro aminopeptidase
VIVGGVIPRSILFCIPKDPQSELWTGKRYGPEDAVLQFGFDEAYGNTPSAAMVTRVATLLALSRHVYTPTAPDTSKGTPDWLGKIIEAHKKNVPETKCSPLQAVLGERRLIKDDEEIALMHKACMISAITHRSILPLVRPGMNEYELEAEITYRFRKAGGDPMHAYPPIVAAGINACTLHYVENNQVMHNGNLVLIDAGCEYRGYASDITRTIPVNKKFSPAQRELYTLVLTAQKAAIDKARAGNALCAVNNTARAVITKGLIGLGLIPRRSKEATKGCARFFPHRTSHFLGLDVHDVGDYHTKGNRSMRILEPGMVITVEPGIYIPPAPDVPEQYWNIGIRIEDDVLITSGKPCVLSAEAPKEIAEIEGIMQRDYEPLHT